MPNQAAAVAVATPCWPAPVSAITRRLPIRRASRSWPRVLLILWAPVNAASSRFSQMSAPPTSAVSRRAWYSGVGRPATSFSSEWKSSWKAGSATASVRARSSSSRAPTSTSGAKRPPYSPNQPRSSGSDTLETRGESAIAAVYRAQRGPRVLTSPLAERTGSELRLGVLSAQQRRSRLPGVVRSHEGLPHEDPVDGRRLQRLDVGPLPDAA